MWNIHPLTLIGKLFLKWSILKPPLDAARFFFFHSGKILFIQPKLGGIVWSFIFVKHKPFIFARKTVSFSDFMLLLYFDPPPWMLVPFLVRCGKTLSCPFDEWWTEKSPAISDTIHASGREVTQRGPGAPSGINQDRQLVPFPVLPLAGGDGRGRQIQSDLWG